MARRRSRGISHHTGCGCSSWLNILTVILVIAKLAGATDLPWWAVTLPTWGPYVFWIVVLYFVAGRSTTRRRSTRRTTSRRRSSRSRTSSRRRKYSKLF